MSDLVAMATDEIVRVAVGRGVPAATSDILKRFRERRRDPEDAREVGGSPEVRSATAAAFADAAVRMRSDLALLNSGPPGLKGSFWTWPVHRATLKRFPDTSSHCLRALLAVETNCGSDVIATAEVVMAALVDALEVYTDPRGRHRAGEAAAVTSNLETFDQALVIFVQAVRRDLGYDKPVSKGS